MKNSFSIIIPAYKEEEFIEKTVRENISVFRQSQFDFETIVVIDRIPNDRTYDIVKELTKDYPEIKLVVRDGKHGVGNAIKDGIKNSSKEVIIILMGDKSEDPTDLPRLATKMNEGYDMVFGNRFYREVKFEGYPLKKYVFNRLCNFVIRITFGIKSNDITNAVKAYRSIILKNIEIKSSGFEIFVELPVRAFINGYRNIAEVPLNHYSRDITYSKFDLFKEGPGYIGILFQCYKEYIKNGK